jgi:hypothetical protein
MTNQLNNKTLISLFRKNYLIFVLSFIFFSLAPIFLINIQSQNTTNLNRVEFKIHNDVSNEIKLNYIIEKVNWYNKVLNRAYTDVSTKTRVENNIIINNQEPDISLVKKSPISLYKINFIEFLYNELIFSEKLTEMSLKNNISLINNYFDENEFDKDYLKYLIKNLDIDLQSHKTHYLKNTIAINSFTDNIDFFTKYTLFLIDFSNNQVLKDFKLYSNNMHKIYEEKYIHLMSISSKMNSKSENIKLLKEEYNPESLKLFLNNQISDIFKLNILKNVKKYDKSFEINQPSILIILIFAFFASIVIVISKDKYLSS